MSLYIKINFTFLVRFERKSIKSIIKIKII
jgi:hypothetical protein